MFCSLVLLSLLVLVASNVFYFYFLWLGEVGRIVELLIIGGFEISAHFLSFE